MTEPPALRPLVEAAESIRRLDDYETPAQLTAAIRAVGDAVDRALRTRLRNDRTAPDSERLNALAPQQLSLEEVIRSLRTRDLISLETAGTVHEAMGAVERVEVGDDPRPGDADAVRAAVDRLRAELAGAAPAVAPDPDPGPAAGADTEGEGSAAAEPAAPHNGRRWMRWLAAAFTAAILAGLTWVAVLGGDAEYDAALAAFRAGRLDSASAGFERVLGERPRDVTAMLFLARSYRRMDRPAEAAEVLREAVELAPEDGDIRRELGHLFMDLDRPVSAVAQYGRALEYEPEQPLNWAALIRALRQNGDPRAEQLLRDAPAEVKARLTGS